MTMYMFFSSVELGLIYAIMALGLYISFKILDSPDLTVDGSFVTGAAVSVMLCTKGCFFLTPLIAFLAGGMAGAITALLNTKLKIQPLLAGILTMLALYSVNLKIMGSKPNVPIINEMTMFKYFNNIFSFDYVKLISLIGILVIILTVLFLFFKTRLGFALRATGNNPDMAKALAINTDAVKIIGLAISNGLVALAGAILAQYQGFADISMGVGIIVVGLASVIIGEVIVGNKTLFISLFATIVGSVIYRLIIAFALQLGMPPTDLKLVSAIVVGGALAIPSLSPRIMKARSKVALTDTRK